MILGWYQVMFVIQQLKQHDIRVVSGYVCHSTIKAT